MTARPSERNLEIYRLAVDEKNTLAALSKQYAISTVRIGQIVQRVGVVKYGDTFNISELRKRAAS